MKRKTYYLIFIAFAIYCAAAMIGNATQIHENQIMFDNAGHDHSGGAAGNPDIAPATLTATGGISAATSTISGNATDATHVTTGASTAGSYTTAGGISAATASITGTATAAQFAATGSPAFIAASGSIGVCLDGDACTNNISHDPTGPTGAAFSKSITTAGLLDVALTLNVAGMSTIADAMIAGFLDVTANTAATPALTITQNGAGPLLRISNGADVLELSNAGEFVLPVLVSGAVGGTDVLKSTSLSGAAAVAGWSEAGGPGVYGQGSSTGTAVSGYASGTGGAATFQINNAANSSDVLKAYTNGTGNVINAYTTNVASTANVFYGRNDGVGDSLFISGNNAGSASDQIVVDTIGQGKLLDLRHTGVTKFSVDKDGYNVAAGYNTAGTATAAQFVGGGAGLTGVTGTDSTKVLKAGDTMTGPLVISGSTGVNPISVTTTGNPTALISADTITTGTNTVPLYGRTNSSNVPAISGVQYGSYPAIYGTTIGSGSAFYAYATTTGCLFCGQSYTATATYLLNLIGLGGYVRVNNYGNLELLQSGAGNAFNIHTDSGYNFVIDKDANTVTDGTITALTFTANSSVATGTSTITGTSNGHAGRAATFETSDAINPEPTLSATTQGLGFAAYVETNNAANTYPSLNVDSNGAGVLISLNAGGNNKFYVTPAGNAWASGTMQADGGYKVGAAAGIDKTYTTCCTFDGSMACTATGTITINKGINTATTCP